MAMTSQMISKWNSVTRVFNFNGKLDIGAVIPLKKSDRKREVLLYKDLGKKNPSSPK